MLRSAPEEIKVAGSAHINHMPVGRDANSCGVATWSASIQESVIRAVKRVDSYISQATSDWSANRKLHP